MDSYYSKKIIPYTDNLIRELATHTPDGYQLNVNELDESVKEIFTGFLITFDARKGAHWEWLPESDNQDRLTNYFAQYLFTLTPDNRHSFIENLVSEAVSVHEHRMQAIIDDRIPYVEQEDHLERGGAYRQHKDNGENYRVAL